MGKTHKYFFLENTQLQSSTKSQFLRGLEYVKFIWLDIKRPVCAFFHSVRILRCLFCLFFLFFFPFFFFDRVSLCSPGYLGIYYVDQAGFTLRNLPVSASLSECWYQRCALPCLAWLSSFVWFGLALFLKCVLTCNTDIFDLKS